MNKFITRIRFCYPNGSDVAYLNQDVEFKGLGLDAHAEDKDLTFLSAGDVVTLGGVQYRVTDIHISYQDYFNSFNPETDINLNVICRVEDIK